MFGLAFFLKDCPQVQMRANSGEILHLGSKQMFTWASLYNNQLIYTLYIQRYAYVKLFFSVPHRWRFTMAKNPHTPQKLLGHSSTIKYNVGTGLGSPWGATPLPTHCSSRHGETVLRSGRHLLLLLCSLSLFWVSLKANIKRFPD